MHFLSSKEPEKERIAVGQYSWNLPASTTRAEHVAENRKRNGILSWNRERRERKGGWHRERREGREGGRGRRERGHGKDDGIYGEKRGGGMEGGRVAWGGCREERLRGSEGEGERLRYEG